MLVYDHLQLYFVHAVLVDDPHVEAEVWHEACGCQLDSALWVRPSLTMGSLGDTLSQNVDGLFAPDALVPVLVHCTQADVYAETVGSVRYDCLCAEVVYPVQVRRRGRGIKAG